MQERAQVHKLVCFSYCNLTGLLATALVVGGQKTPKPSALQNVTITSVEDGDNYCLNVDFDYSGSGVCKCDVKSVQGRKKKSFGSIKQCENHPPSQE